MKLYVRILVGAMLIASVVQADGASKQNGDNLACFNNSYMRGCVRAYLSKDKKSISVAASLKSHSNKSVQIGLLSTCYTGEGDYSTGDSSCKPVRSSMPDYSLPNASLITGGMSLRAKTTQGAAIFFRRWVDRNKVDIDNMTVLDPGGNMTLVFHFVSEKPIESSMYDFSAQAVMYIPSAADKKQYTKRKFTISGTDVYFPSK